jgi:hypothetical protein
MKITNLSAEPAGILRSWLPAGLDADTVVFLPDACPGKSPLPTGTAVLTRQRDWRRFAVSDCGCGMRLLKSTLRSEDLTQDMWDDIAVRIRQNKGGLGDLGGGNHFLDALLPYDSDNLYFLVHTGSRSESGLVDRYVDSGARFEEEFERVMAWAEKNRAAIQGTIESVTGSLDMILDHPHNTFEHTADGIIIRKGSVRVYPGDYLILPSHMTGDAVLLRANHRVNDILNSMSHGTGRTMSRGDAKIQAAVYDFDAMRRRVILPTFLQNASLNTEGPFAYRDLDDCLALIDGYVEEIRRFGVVAYAGHL